MIRPEPSAASTEALIADLAGGLRPVRRLPAPWLRSALWLAVVLLGAAVLATVFDPRVALARVLAAPDLWLAALGAVLTAILAAWAACALSVPGYSSRWAWLPVPSAVLWLGASGLGCLRGLVLVTLHRATWSDAMTQCLPFILRNSVLLAIPLGVLLCWARPLRPGLVAAMGGLAVAAASASLLLFDHPFDASIEDLVVHVVAVLGVVLACRLLAFILPARWSRRRTG